MRKSWLPLVFAGALSTGGCAYVGLAPVLADVINGAGRQGYADPDFGRAAAEACRGHAARYGRVTITNVETQSGNAMRVYGTVDQASRTRSFGCTFRSDGRITDFDFT
ncbi:MAG TPA: hypothetical protein VNT77_07050 [Allosphingosinicella sp.]|nr:hypothetical protein [Allosphingosinicella sp.]